MLAFKVMRYTYSNDDFKNQNVSFVSISIKVYVTKLMIDRFTDLVLYNKNFEDVSVGTGLAYYKDISKVFPK